MSGGVKVGLEAIKAIVKSRLEEPGFAQVLKRVGYAQWRSQLEKLRDAEGVKLLSAGNGQCVAEMVVSEHDQNPIGTLHGGLTATLVDEISTYAVMTTGSGAPGVSVDIHVSYLKGAPVGEELIIDANTLRVGKRLAFLDVIIKKKLTGEIIAKGSHTKFVG